MAFQMLQIVKLDKENKKLKKQVQEQKENGIKIPDLPAERQLKNLITELNFIKKSSNSELVKIDFVKRAITFALSDLISRGGKEESL